MFKYCERLKSVRLNEGLEKLGKFAFSGTAIEAIELPSTLKRIEAETFSWCRNLKRVEIPNGVEHIEEKCFYGSAITEITLPNTLKEMGENAFNGCNNLQTVWVEEGCALDIGKYVGKDVEVRRK